MVNVSPDLADRLRDGESMLEVVGAAAADAERAAQLARRAVWSVAHPEQPDGPFVSYVSAVGVTPDGFGFTIDAKDLGAYPDIADAFVAAIRHALDAAALDCMIRAGEADRLTLPEPPPPPEPFVLPPDLPLPDLASEITVDGTAEDGSACFWSTWDPDSLRAFWLRELPALGYSVVNRAVHRGPGDPGIEYESELLEFGGVGRLVGVAVTKVRPTRPMSLRPKDQERLGWTRVDVSVRDAGTDPPG